MIALCTDTSLDLSIPADEARRGIGAFWIPFPEAFCERLFDDKPFGTKNKAPESLFWAVVFWLKKTSQHSLKRAEQYTKTNLTKWSGRHHTYVQKIMDRVEAAWRKWNGLPETCAPLAHPSRTPSAPQDDVCVDTLAEVAHPSRTPSAPLAQCRFSTSRARDNSHNTPQEQQSLPSGVISPPSSMPSSNSVETTATALGEEEVLQLGVRTAAALPPAPEPLPEPALNEPVTKPVKPVLPVPAPAALSLAAHGDPLATSAPLPAPVCDVEADPRRMTLEAAFRALGEEHLEAARMLHLAGFGTLGCITALEGRGALIGQLKPLRRRQAPAGSHSAYLIEQLRRPGTLPQVAETVARILRRHRLWYGQPAAEIVSLSQHRALRSSGNGLAAQHDHGPAGQRSDWDVDFGVNLDKFFGGSGGIGSDTDVLADVNLNQLDGDIYDLAQPIGAK